MLLLRDQVLRAHNARLLERHLGLIRDVHSGQCDLTELYAAKLIDTLAIAAQAKLYEESLRDWRGDKFVTRAKAQSADTILRETFAALPLLSKEKLREQSRDAFTRDASKFLHYYESSGTTGDRKSTRLNSSHER